MAIGPDDLYRDLGVTRDATAEELSAAFRRRAKELHPDAGKADPGETEEFKQVSRAYAVLRDPARRARYDEQGSVVGAARSRPVDAPRTSARAGTGVDANGAAAPSRPWRLTPRGARRAVGAGVAFVVLGLVAGAWVVSVQRRDAELRDRGVAADATVVEVDGRRRLRFTTRAGDVVVASEVTRSGTEGPPLGATVGIHYDRDDPTRVVADVSHTARDVTLWIVAVKLVVGGLVLLAVGLRRLRR